MAEQTELPLLSRAELLEKQHRILKDNQEFQKKIDELKADITIWREQMKCNEQELRKVTMQLEGNQMTLGIGA